MSTESTASLMKQFVAQILDAPPTTTGGGTVRELIADRVYVGRPPDNATYSYVIARLVGLRSDPNFDVLRVSGTLEVTVMARPRTRAEEAEEIADRIVQALAGYRSATRGLTWTTGFQRDTLPVFHDPADSDVVSVRIAASFSAWPQLLTA